MKAIDYLRIMAMLVILCAGVTLAFIGARGTAIHYSYWSSTYDDVFMWGVLILACLGTWKLIEISNRIFKQWKEDYPAYKIRLQQTREENYRRNHMTFEERKDEIEKQHAFERKELKEKKLRLDASVKERESKN